MKTNNKYEILRKKLLEKIEEKNLSVAALERRAGLKGHAIRNILSGRSKKPSLENLQAAVNVLGGSVEELFNDKEEINSEGTFLQNLKLNKSILIENTRLFKNVVDLVLSIYEYKLCTPFMEQATFIIKVVYDFSNKDQSDQPDKKFAEWMITKSIEMNTT